MVSPCSRTADFQVPAAGAAASVEGDDSLARLSPSELFERISQWEAGKESQGRIDLAFEELAQRPFSLDLIEGLLAREGKPISPAERRLMIRLQREMPERNKVLLSYELLQRETDRMDFRRLPRAVLEAQGEPFEVYDISQSPFRFFVYSAALWKTQIRETRERKIESGIMCASLISDEEPDFFRQDRQYAVVLSVDPRSIVATARQDIFSPYGLNDPATFSHYRFYERLQVLTGLVDSLHRRSCVQSPHASSDFSRLLRLQSDPILARSEEALPLMKSLNTPSRGLTEVLYQEGETLAQLREMGRLPEERRPAELERISRLMQRAQFSSCYRHYANPLQGAGELLAQTSGQSNNGENEEAVSPYNEVELALEAGRPIQIKAILITREGFEADRARYLPILQDAKRQGIPILVHALTPRQHAKKLFRAIQNRSDAQAKRLLSSPFADAAMGEQALIPAAAKGLTDTVEWILHRWEMPDAAVLKAFDAAKKPSGALENLVSARPVLLREKAWEALFSEEVPERSIRLLDPLQSSLSAVEGFGLKAFREALARNRFSLAHALYEKYKAEIPNEELRAALPRWVDARLDVSWEQFPPEQAALALRHALARGNGEAAFKIGGLPSVRGAIDGPLAGQLLRLAVEKGASAMISSLAGRKDIPEADYKAAFEFAATEKRIPDAIALFKCRKELLAESFLQVLSDMFSERERGSLLLSFAKEGIEIPAEYAEEAFREALNRGENALANEIYRTHHESIPDEAVKLALTVQISKGRYPALDVSPRFALWAIGCAIDWRSDELIGSLVDAYGRGLSEKEIEDLIQKGIEAESNVAIRKLVWVYEKNPHQMARYALLHAVEKGRYLPAQFILGALNWFLPPEILCEAHAAAEKAGRRDLMQIIETARRGK